MIRDVSIKYKLTYCIQQYYPNQWELYFHHCRFVDDELIIKIANLFPISTNCMLAKSFVVCLIRHKQQLSSLFLLYYLKEIETISVDFMLRNHMQSSRKISQKTKLIN